MIQINELAQSVSATGLTAGMKYAVTVSGDFGGESEPPVVVSIFNRQQNGEYVELPVSLRATNRQVTVTVVGNELLFSAAPLYTDTILNIEVLRLPLSDRPDNTNVVSAIEENPGAIVTALSAVTDTNATTINLTAADSGKILRCTSGSSVTINMPSTDPGGNFSVAVIRAGAGSVTFAANGKTLNSYNSLLSIAGQHAWASLIRVAANTYNLSGTLI